MGKRAGGVGARLRRDLGALETYAALVGILVGAGIFTVTSDASALTGPSVIFGHVVLMVAVVATAVPYMVFLSTSLGTEPGGEYAHIRETFRSPRLAFLGAWLKLISYIGAGAFLASALADYVLALLGILGLDVSADAWRTPLAAASLAFFFGVHALGVRWFGRVQVTLCAVLGVSIVVLVVPGLFEVELENFRPFWSGGARGFASSLPPLFFAWAGFESLAHSGGEVRESRAQLPRTFLRGLLLTGLIFIAMSVVAFGVLPKSALEASNAPMAEVAAVYLPAGGAALVAIGGVAAVATSLNASFFVPSRLGLLLAEHGFLPAWLGSIHPASGTPVLGLVATFVLTLLLLLTGQTGLALGIAVFSLIVLYLLHALALLFLPGSNPELYAEVTSPVPRSVQVAAVGVSLLGMGALLLVQVRGSLVQMFASDFGERMAAMELTTLELFVAWALLGLLVAGLAHRR